MQTTQPALLSCFPLSAEDCKSGACQENRQRSYVNFIFLERPACQKRTGGQRQPLPLAVCFSLLDFRDGFSLHCLALPLLCQHLLHPWAKHVLQASRHLKLCSVKAGYCQCFMSTSKKYLAEGLTEVSATAFLLEQAWALLL